MKKLIDAIRNAFGDKVLSAVLDAVITKENLELLKTEAISFLEQYALSTKNEVDDKIVARIKEVLEK